jgi:hypothetical protein
MNKKYKKLKVYWNGELMSHIYPHATKFQVFKYRAGRFIARIVKLTLLTSAGLAIIMGAFVIGKTLYPKTIYAEKAVVVEVDNLSGRVEQLKNETLAQLKVCETGSKTEAHGVITFDSNKKASIGLYQFQVATVQHYYKTLYSKEISAKEAIEIALDEELSGKLARDIIFKTTNGIDNWLNCRNKGSLADNVKWINKITN